MVESVATLGPLVPLVPPSLSQCLCFYLSVCLSLFLPVKLDHPAKCVTQVQMS